MCRYTRESRKCWYCPKGVPTEAYLKALLLAEDLSDYLKDRLHTIHPLKAVQSYIYSLTLTLSVTSLMCAA